MTRSAVTPRRRVVPLRQPRGREQVRRALIEAAAELFAEHGPAGVSVRDVAARAGVNHGLVHQYFGSKRALLGEVLEYLAEQISARAEEVEITELLEATAGNPFWRVLARAILDGEDVRRLQKSFPTVGRIVDFFTDLRAQGRFHDLDPKILSALVVGLGLGWLLFEPFLIPAAGLGDRPVARVREELRRTGFALAARLAEEPTGRRNAAVKKRKRS
jgi:AcrR family transcriptional regulator